MTNQHTDEMRDCCKCTLRIRLTGDGCRYCNPQEYIDSLHEQIEEHDTKITRYQDALRKATVDMQAVINRWDSPSWKDVPHTANYIHKLRERVTTINKLLGDSHE